MITCEIQMKLPSINQYIDLCRGNKYVAAKKKREIESDLAVFLARLPRFTKPIHVDFVWIEKYRKRDPSSWENYQMIPGNMSKVFRINSNTEKKIK